VLVMCHSLLKKVNHITSTHSRPRFCCKLLVRPRSRIDCHAVIGEEVQIRTGAMLSALLKHPSQLDVAYISNGYQVIESIDGTDRRDP
jgi:hypothetical protein